MPESVSGFTYGIGFVLATAVLHAVGVGLGLAIGSAGQNNLGQRIAQVGGGAMVAAGVVLLSNTL